MRDPGAQEAELPASAYVVLGMIGLGLRSGYEIKRAVDESTRHFAAISFRQIYPELKRMQDNGLVLGSDATTGGRRRTFYELTPSGEHALEAWLKAEEPVTTELRHSGLLKLFFADRLDLEDRLVLVERIRRHHHQTRAMLADARPGAERRASLQGGRLPLVTLDFGVELSDFMIAWCDRLKAELRDSGPDGA